MKAYGIGVPNERVIPGLQKSQIRAHVELYHVLWAPVRTASEDTQVLGRLPTTASLFPSSYGLPHPPPTLPSPSLPCLPRTSPSEKDKRAPVLMFLQVFANGHFRLPERLAGLSSAQIAEPLMEGAMSCASGDSQVIPLGFSSRSTRKCCVAGFLKGGKKRAR